MLNIPISLPMGIRLQEALKATPLPPMGKPKGDIPIDIEKALPLIMSREDMSIPTESFPIEKQDQWKESFPIDNQGGFKEALESELKKTQALSMAEPTEGKVIKAYHGSGIGGLQEIGFGEGIRSNTFMGSIKKVKSGAIFFTPDKETAQFFAQNREQYLKDLKQPAKATVYERELNILNPIDLTNLKKADKALEKVGIDVGKHLGILTNEPNDLLTYAESRYSGKGEKPQDVLLDLWELFDKPEVVQQLKAAGFDGAILKEKYGGGKGISYAIFDPKQAKLSPTGEDKLETELKRQIGVK